MADSKRNSVAGKIATPKPAAPSSTPPAQSVADPLQALGKSIGARYVHGPREDRETRMTFPADPLAP